MPRVIGGFGPRTRGLPLEATSARHLGVPVVTRDRRIIAYGRAGHVEVIRC